MDTVDVQTRSRMMSRIRAKDTKPEILLRKELWRQGIRYRLHQRHVMGTPDLSHIGRRVAVFIDGCFWHGCPEHYRKPSSRVAYWNAKLRRNKTRRREVLAELKRTKWSAVQVWECEIRNNLPAAAARVAAFLAGKNLNHPGRS